MKKYNVLNLYLVEVQDGIDAHYFICERNKRTNTYVEVFTGEKIKIQANSLVDSLICYYNTNEQCELAQGKEKWPCKKELLQKYLEINKKINFRKARALDQNNGTIDIISILNEAIQDFFPKDILFYDGQSKEMASYIPPNFRDDLWLAIAIKQRKELLYISTNSVLQFIKTSPLFQEKRHEYEQKVVKEYINLTGCSILSPACDIEFRENLIHILLKIGLCRDAIEEEIEKNAYVWRDSLMEKAFLNRFEPVGLAVPLHLSEYDDPEKALKGLEPADEEFKANWLKMRKYEYYQAHKDSVDKYGAIDPAMTMSEEEVQELGTYLVQKESERIVRMEEYQKERDRDKGHSKVLN